MKAADKKAIHRLLMQSPMVSAREIAKTLNCDLKDVEKMYRQIWTQVK